MGAYYHNGNDHIDWTSLDLSGSAITLGFQFNMVTGVDNAANMFFTTYEAGVATNIVIRMNKPGAGPPFHVQTIWFTDSTDDRWDLSSYFSLDTWYNVVLCKDRTDFTTLGFWVNGTDVSGSLTHHTTGTGNPDTGADTLRMGENSSGTADVSDGYSGPWFWHNAALSDAACASISAGMHPRAFGVDYWSLMLSGARENNSQEAGSVTGSTFQNESVRITHPAEVLRPMMPFTNAPWFHYRQLMAA